MAHEWYGYIYTMWLYGYMTLLLWHGLAVYGYMTKPLLWLLKPYGYAMVWLYMTIGLYGLVAMHGMAVYMPDGSSQPAAEAHDSQ